MFQWLIYQWQLLLLAIGFFSRLPIPVSTPYSDIRMNHSGRYFPLVGLLLGGMCALVYTLAHFVLPVSTSLFLMMVFSLMLTGAFHEDGLADMADGIGGGMTVERRLSIMKDSRIGTYGASALMMALLGKFVLLNEVEKLDSLVMIVIIAYGFSRSMAASFIYDMPYVTQSDGSKSKPLANQQSTAELSVILLTGILPLLWLSPSVVVILLISFMLLRFSFKHWLLDRLDGFTGDCLGAAQQLSELIFYLIIVGASPVFQHQERTLYLLLDVLKGWMI
ncbi:adenosylcobinamide-GDP ribazoletransferase [Vibrio hibernica]|uniref:adenosylcobinamide-GDP ribazoletransferase n=1 Tax=Vibrio hibernica TaxID=2587465 RepID=UPI0039AEE89E